MEDEAAHRIQYAHLRIFREKLQGGSVYIAIITEGEEEDLRGGGGREIHVPICRGIF